MNTELTSWMDTPTRQTIMNYIRKVASAASPDFVPPEERVATFDNGGALWNEKPYVQAGLVFERLTAMAENDPALRHVQPWQAAYEKNVAWFNEAVARHYQGDDSEVKTLLGGIIKSIDEKTVESFHEEVRAYFQRSRHPKYRRSYLEVAYRPMIELLRYLEIHGFTTYIASGGGRDFMRVISQQVYGIPPERVIGSAPGLTFHYQENRAYLMRQAGLNILDDGPTKPVQIWDRIGRRPILAAGNSDGDIPMLQFADSANRLSLCLLVNHDDAEREDSYVQGAKSALRLARERGWTVISMQQDWSNIFIGAGAKPPSVLTRP